MEFFRDRKVRIVTSIALFCIPIFIFPSWWCGREANELFNGNGDSQEMLVKEVVSWIQSGVKEEDFHTGNWQFNGEWQFASCQMAGLGLLQFIRKHPRESFTISTRHRRLHSAPS